MLPHEQRFLPPPGPDVRAGLHEVMGYALGYDGVVLILGVATAFGTRMEPRAVRMYERVTGHAVEPTGLHMHDNLRWGASPDGIVTTAANETGLLEVKCSFRHRERRLFTPSCREQACSRSSAPSATGGEAPCRSCKTAPPSSSPRSKASSP